MARPWEMNIGLRPWEAAEFVYPRKISIYRLAASADAAPVISAGPLPFQEAQASNGASVFGSPIFSGIAASIQEETRGTKDGEVQTASRDLVPFYRIFIHRAALALGSVKAHDFIIDDIGAKYRVQDPYWDSLGYRLLCIFTEV